MNSPDPPSLPGTWESEAGASSWSRLHVVVVSFLAVSIWPMLGVLAAYPMFESPWEAAFPFGGISALLLLPLAFVGNLGNTAFAVALVVMWVATWLLPVIWLTSRRRSRRVQAMTVATLSGISFGQAALGFLMILGKGC